MGELVAAAAGVHAPQLLSRPPFEDPAKLQAGIDALGEFGAVLEETGAETLIIVGTDHLETFWLEAVPQFLVVVGDRIDAHYSSFSASVRGDADYASALLHGAVQGSIDLSYSQEANLGHAFLTPMHYVLGDRDIPVVPLLVNVYLPPLPSPKRCYQLGMALRSVIEQRPERVAILASGGMSHFPGTERYYDPDLDFDRWVIQQVERGDWDELLELSPVQLDEVGEGELLTWFVLVGAMGRRPGRVRSFQQLPHHDQGVVQFLPLPDTAPVTTEPVPRHGGHLFEQRDYRWYRFPDPSTFGLNKFLHRLAVDGDYRRRFVAARADALLEGDITAAEQQLAAAEDFPALGLPGAHPLLALNVRQLLEQERRAQGLATAPI